MTQAEVAAHLEDVVAATEYIREAYELGLPHGNYVFTRWDWRPLRNHGLFEELMAPKG